MTKFMSKQTSQAILKSPILMNIGEWITVHNEYPCDKFCPWSVWSLPPFSIVRWTNTKRRKQTFFFNPNNGSSFISFTRWLSFCIIFSKFEWHSHLWSNSKPLFQDYKKWGKMIEYKALSTLNSHNLTPPPRLNNSGNLLHLNTRSLQSKKGAGVNLFG